jgi:predicted RNA-binding protein YlqC (UPF0109 family)
MDAWQDIDTASLFEALCCWLVKAPCTISVKETPNTLLLEITVPPSHVGQLIGKGGETIRALRRLSMTGRTREQQIVINVMDGTSGSKL